MKSINETQTKIIQVLATRNEMSEHEVENNLRLLEVLGKDVKKYKKLINKEA